MSESWMTDPVPETFELADGKWVPLKVGQRVYNYYDMKPGTIGKLPTRGQPFTGGPKGTAWWCDVIHDDYSSAILDGSRLCTMETAIARGYHEQETEYAVPTAYVRYKVQQWAVVNASDDYYYGAPYSYIRAAFEAKVIGPEEFEVLCDSLGEQLHYRGD